MPDSAGEARQHCGFNPRLWLWLFSSLTFLFVAIASWWLYGPIIHADEGGYLLNAAAIAGRLDSSIIWGSYYSGYSLLLTPAWWLFSDPRHIYHACLIINALLLATLPVGLYWLLSMLVPQSHPRTRFLAALAGAWQAPVLAMSQLAFSENALVPCYVWFLTLLAVAIADRDERFALGAGLLAGYLFLIHPRGVLLAAPVLITTVVATSRERFSAKWTTALIAGALFATAVHRPLELLAGKHGTAQGANYDLAQLTHAVVGSFTWSRFAVDLLGVTAYVLVSSFTFVAMGALASRFCVNGNSATRAVTQGMVLALMVCIMTTAIGLVGGPRIDYVIHGRYVVPAMIPLIACGALVFFEGGQSAWWIAAGTLLLIALSGWMFEHLTLPPRTPWMPENVIGLYPPLKIAGGVYWTAIAAYFVVFFLIVSTIRLRFARAAIISFILINGTIAAVFIALQLEPQSYGRNKARVLVRTVAKLEAKRHQKLCIVLSPDVDHWHLVDYRFWLYRNLPQGMRSGTPCIHALIAPPTKAPGAGWEAGGETPTHSMELFLEVQDSAAADAQAIAAPSIIAASLGGSRQ